MAPKKRRSASRSKGRSASPSGSAGSRSRSPGGGMMRVNDTSGMCDKVQALHQFQCGPAHWLITHPAQRGVLCCYGTGYGKSLTAVTTITALVDAGVVQRCVVVTPLSLKDNMAKEFAKCGSGPLVQAALAATTIISYETAVAKGEEEMKGGKVLLVVDEVHNLKNEASGEGDADGSQRNKVLQAMAAKAAKVLLLTGTPMPNSPADLVPLLRLIDPSVPALSSNPAARALQVAPAALAQHAKHLVAFPGVDLKAEFPTEHPETIFVGLDAEQTEVLDKLDTHNKRKADGRKVQEKVYMTKPRKASLFVSKDVPSPKIRALADHLEKTPRRPALVFSEFTTDVVDLIQATLKARKLRVAQLTGKTPAQQRQQLVNRMNAGGANGLDVLILSSAGAEGLDFQKVREVHLLTPDWTPGEVDQKVGRAVRFRSHKDKGLSPGQQTVHTYRYVSVPEGEDGQAYLEYPGDDDPPILSLKQVGPGVWEYVRVAKPRFLPSRYAELYLVRQEQLKRAAIVAALEAIKNVGIPQKCFDLVPKPKKATPPAGPPPAAPSGRLGLCSAMNPSVKLGQVFRAINGYNYLAVEAPGGRRRWVRLRGNSKTEVAKSRTPNRTGRIGGMCAAHTAKRPKMKQGSKFTALNGITYRAVRAKSRDGSVRLRFQRA